MNVLMISPGYPGDMPYFTRGLARVGAHVLGVGDQPKSGLPPAARSSLSDYLQVKDLWDEGQVVDAVRRWLGGRSIERVECLWEPGVVLAARLREAFSVPGMRVEQAMPLRDKESMKAVLDSHGIRTPHHYRAQTAAEVQEAAEKVGYPLIVKPIDGAGSADTYRVDSDAELEAVLQAIRHVPHVSVEEFIEGEEYTYDTVSAHGQPLFENVAWYRPKPLVMRQNPWISPQAICMRDLKSGPAAVGCELGRRVLQALSFESGFTHMEWFHTPEGEAIFGEIGGRAPGGRLTHGMNYSADIDLFTGWAEAVCTGRLSQSTEKPFNAALVFKRATGQGRIERIEGLERLMGRYGDAIPLVDLVPIGQPRRDPGREVTGDGWLVARHPDLEITLEIADAIATDLRIFAS